MKKLLPVLFYAACAIWLGWSLRTPRSAAPFDAAAFGRLPVLANGRVKPLDTVARTSLMILSGKQTLSVAGRGTVSATEWLMDVLLKPEAANVYEVIRIDNPDVLGLLGFEQTEKKRFSLRQLEPHLAEVERQARLADTTEESRRSLFQREVLKLYHRLELHQRLKNSVCLAEDADWLRELDLFEQSVAAGIAAVQKRQANEPFDREAAELLAAFVQKFEFLATTAYFLPVPPPHAETDASGWSNIGQSLLDSLKNGKVNPSVRHYANLVNDYRRDDAPAFNRGLIHLRQEAEGGLRRELTRTDCEYRFNLLQPFYQCMVLYVVAFVLVLASWLKPSEWLSRTTFHVLAVSLALHTCGLLTRMYLQGRPPVTNLYSSAVFVGWGAVLLGLILERIYRDGIGAVTASVLGFLTLLVAHHLSGEGDTLELLRAVLDTNYWLATHVVVITLGYAATFLAGFLAIVYILRGALTRSMEEATARSLERMVYGIICFATLFSFVGTVLGGIWADQSWGRFWGWDPKENGALIIVLWNAAVLHARWGGMIRRRGLMVMAIFGNIVTSFSWFGVNMLGVGLHSYGFMEKAFVWLVVFIASQLALMILGLAPQRR